MAIGKLLVVIGILLTVIGLVLNYAPWLINWFGKLPGDIRIEDDKKRIYIPLVSMLVISIIVSFILNVFFRK
jgi:xanthine/uracil permease